MKTDSKNKYFHPTQLGMYTHQYLTYILLILNSKSYNNWFLDILPITKSHHLTLKLLVFFFKLVFYFPMLFIINEIFLCEIDTIQWTYIQHCAYWWPGALAWCFSIRASVATVLSIIHTFPAFYRLIGFHVEYQCTRKSQYSAILVFTSPHIFTVSFMQCRSSANGKIHTALKCYGYITFFSLPCFIQYHVILAPIILLYSAE